MQNLFLIPKGTRFFLISAEPSIELCLNNDIVDSLTFKLPPKSLIGLAINTPLSVNSADAFVNVVEDNVEDVINVLPDLYQLETFYHRLIERLHQQLLVSGEEFNAYPPLFWDWVGDHTLMLAHNHDKQHYKQLQQLSKGELEKYIAAYGPGLF